MNRTSHTCSCEPKSIKVWYRYRTCSRQNCWSIILSRDNMKHCSFFFFKEQFNWRCIECRSNLRGMFKYFDGLLSTWFCKVVWIVVSLLDDIGCIGERFGFFGTDTWEIDSWLIDFVEVLSEFCVDWSFRFRLCDSRDRSGIAWSIHLSITWYIYR
jgi:hypothetical protein